MDGRDTLDVFDFGTLFQSLVRTLKTGTLRVSCGQTEKYLYMNRGKIEAVFTSQSRFLLGHILVRMRALDPADLDTILEQQKVAPEHLLLGEGLVAAGLIDTQILDAAILYQMMEELLEVFYWESPRYQFYPGPIDETLPDVPRKLNRVGASLPIDEILLYVTKTMDDIARFQEVCPSLRDVYQPLVDPDGLNALADSTPDDQKIFSLLDGRRSVSDLFSDLIMTQYEVMERICALRKADFIRPADREELMALATEEDPPLAVRTRLSMLTRARELGLANPDLWKHLARALEELNRTAKAIEAWLNYSRRAMGGGETEAAIEGAKVAVRLGPAHLPAHEQLLSIQVAVGREDRQAEVLSDLARIHAENGDLGQASEALERAAGLTPENEAVLLARAKNYETAGIARAAGDAYLDLGKVRAQSGMLKAAEDAFAKAVELAPSSVRARDALIGLQLEAGRVSEAALGIQDMIPFLLSTAPEMEEEPIEVLRSLRKRFAGAGCQGEAAMLDLADASLLCGSPGLAITILKEATAAAREAGNLVVAARAVTKALELKPNSIGLLTLAAKIHVLQGDTDAAARQHRCLVDIYGKVGEVVKREVSLRDLLACCPHDAGVIEDLAAVLTARGADSEAAEQTFRLGHLHYVAGRSKQAVECYDRACRLAPDQARYSRFLSVALAEVLGTGDSLGATESIFEMFQQQGDHLALLQAALPPLTFGLSPPVRRSTLRDSYRKLGQLF